MKLGVINFFNSSSMMIVPFEEKYRIGGKIVDFSINLSAFDNEYNENSYWLRIICTKKATNDGIVILLVKLLAQ